MSGNEEMVGIIDYGAGNIRSVSNALNRLSVPHVSQTISKNLIKPINLFFRESAKLEVPWMLLFETGSLIG
jgi:hypothetical protein